MNYIDFAIQDLKKYKMLKVSIENLEDKIRYLNDDFDSIKGVCSSKTPTASGGNKREDYLLSNIVERERLTMNYKTTKKLLDIIDNGLDALTNNEKMVLDYFFISRPKNHLERLSQELHLERSQVYKLKESALYKFTISMYGVSDL